MSISWSTKITQVEFKKWLIRLKMILMVSATLSVLQMAMYTAQILTLLCMAPEGWYALHTWKV